MVHRLRYIRRGKVYAMSCAAGAMRYKGSAGLVWQQVLRGDMHRAVFDNLKRGQNGESN